MITVAVDAGGADLGPDEVAAGASQAARGGIGVLLFGPAAQMESVAEGVEIINAPVSIAKAPDPAFAVRTTPEASIVQAAKAVAEGRAEALVSGGSTGSALAAALFNLRRDRGIYRPALALPLPIPGSSPVLLLDVGANVTCRPEHMVQFAYIGSAFAQAIREAAMSSWRAKLGGLLLSPAVRRLRDEIDPEAQGGAYMLGLRQIGVVAHGRFTRRGFARAIEVAARGVQEDVIGRTRAALMEAGALRSSPGQDEESPSETTATVSEG